MLEKMCDLFSVFFGQSFGGILDRAKTTYRVQSGKRHIGRKMRPTILFCKKQEASGYSANSILFVRIPLMSANLQSEICAAIERPANRSEQLKAFEPLYLSLHP